MNPPLNVFFYFVLPVIIIVNVVGYLLDGYWKAIPLTFLMCALGIQIIWGRHRFQRCDHCGWDRFLHNGARNYNCSGWTKERDIPLVTKYLITCVTIILVMLGIVYVLKELL